MKRSVAAVAGLVLACTACGGGGSHRLSHDELARRAAKICGEQAQLVLQIPRGPATPENAAGYYGAVVSVVQRGVKKFHALEPPTADEAAYKKLLAELDRNLDILRTLRATAAARLRKQYVVALASLHRSRLKIDALDRKLGFSGCV